MKKKSIYEEEKEAEYKSLKALREAAASFGIKNLSRKDRQTITEEIESIKLSISIASQNDPNDSSVIIAPNDDFEKKLKKDQEDLRRYTILNELLEKQKLNPRKKTNPFYYSNGTYHEIN